MPDFLSDKIEMIQTPIHVIDFEGNRRTGIVEYGVVSLLGNKVVSTLTGLSRPSGKISDRDRFQHGINESDVCDCELFQSNWETFSGLRASGVFCAHSAGVEDALLRRVWPCPRLSPDFFDLNNNEITWVPWLDTLSIYRRIYPDQDSYRLEDLNLLFELQADLDRIAKVQCPSGRRHYHAALYDALASALLLTRLYDEPDFGAVTLYWLLRQSQPSGAAQNSIGQQEFTL